STALCTTNILLSPCFSFYFASPSPTGFYTLSLHDALPIFLIAEIIADVDESHREIVLLIHWAGGSHSELRLKKRETGQHRRCTSMEAVEVVRQMAGRFTDESIAATLNRLGMRTGMGNTWDKNRVYSLRHQHQFPNFDPQQPCSKITLKEAARRLQVSEGSVRQMILEKTLPATQVVECAPWEIPVE